MNAFLEHIILNVSNPKVSFPFYLVVVNKDKRFCSAGCKEQAEKLEKLEREKTDPFPTK